MLLFQAIKYITTAHNITPLKPTISPSTLMKSSDDLSSTCCAISAAGATVQSRTGMKFFSMLSDISDIYLKSGQNNTRQHTGSIRTAKTGENRMMGTLVENCSGNRNNSEPPSFHKFIWFTCKVSCHVHHTSATFKHP